MSSAQDTAARWWPWLLTGTVALPLMLYIWTASAGPYWLDSGEFVAAAWTQGIPHPPGHPLYNALAQASGVLPVGSVALRLNLMSGLFAALSCGVLAWVCRRLALWLRVPARSAALIASGSGLLAGTSYALWFQSVRAEVYTLHLLTSSVLVALVIEMELRASRELRADPRLLLGVAFVTGLGLANHHYLVVFLSVPVVLYLLVRKAWRRVLFSWQGLRACGLGLMGLMAYAYLPIRAALNPSVNWGDPDTFGKFWSVITAEAFQKSLDRAQDVDALKLAMDLGGQVGRQITPVGTVLALCGLFWLLKSRWRRGVGALLGGWIAFNLVTQSLFNFDPLNPDVHGYFALTAWMLALLCGVCLCALFHGAREVAHFEKSLGVPSRADLASRAPVLGGAVAMVMAVANLWLTLPDANLNKFRDVDVVNIAALDPLPEGALLLTSNYKTIFNLWFAQSVEKRRPDVDIVHRNFFANPPYIETLEADRPGLVKLALGAGENNRLNISELRKMAAQRPVYVEYDVNVQKEVASYLVPEGLFFRVSPEPVPQGRLPRELGLAQIAHWQGLENHLKVRREGRPLELETQRFLVWVHYLTAMGLIDGQHKELARFHVDSALKINPDAPELKTMREKLR